MTRAQKLSQARSYLSMKGYADPTEMIRAGEVQRMLVEFSDEMLASVHETAVRMLKPVPVSEVVARSRA